MIGQTCIQDSLIVRNIKAFDTDNTINREFQNHQVYINRGCTTNNKLLLHLVGSFDNPVNTTFFPALAANNGFKVINLKYPNNVSAKGACGNSSDMDCFRKYRQEIIFGENASTEVSVDSSNSIINRVLKLLLHLDSLYPSENWNSHLAGTDAVDWSKIVLSGHSQGGGHAAFLAKQFKVHRVLMFASPNDFSNSFLSPASWVSESSTTPDSSYFAFGNLFDDVIDFNQQFQIWELMNLLEDHDSINVDNLPGTYNRSKVLYTTNSQSTIPSGNHNAMILDKFTPMSSGAPLFISVWKYMLGLHSITTSIENNNVANFNVEVFPNPTRNRLFVKSREEVATVEVYNSTGNLRKKVKPTSKDFEINLESLTGFAFIKLTLKNSKSAIMKIVVN